MDTEPPKKARLGKTVITFGTFDLFHIGHLNILRRAAALGDSLIVGISTDKLNFEKKQRYPVYNQRQRKEIVAAIQYVDVVFDEESMDDKAAYIRKHGADILVMGSDWAGKFDHFESMCSVVYLPRTHSISTTEVVEKIRQ